MKPVIVATPTAESMVTEIAATARSGCRREVVVMACMALFSFRSPNNARVKRRPTRDRDRLLPVVSALGPHMGEKDDVPDAGAVGEQHHQPVDAEAAARARRQAVFERADVVGVVVHRFLVAGIFHLRLFQETRSLV